MIEASSKGEIDAVKLLLDAGSLTSYKGAGALVAALKSGADSSPQVVEELVRRGCEPSLLSATTILEIIHQGRDKHLAALSALDSAGVSPRAWDGELQLESFNAGYLQRESTRLRAARMATLMGEFTISSRKIVHH